MNVGWRRTSSPRPPSCLAVAGRDSLPSRARGLVAGLVLVDALAIAIALTVGYVGRFGATTAVVGRGVSGVGVLLRCCSASRWLADDRGPARLRAAVPRGRRRGVRPRHQGDLRRLRRHGHRLVHGEVRAGPRVRRRSRSRSGCSLLLVGRFTRAAVAGAAAAGRPAVPPRRRPRRACVGVRLRRPAAAGAARRVHGRRRVPAGPRRASCARATASTCSATTADVASVAVAVRADVVAVTASDSITPEKLRRIAWSLEGAGRRPGRRAGDDGRRRTAGLGATGGRAAAAVRRRAALHRVAAAGQGHHRPGRRRGRAGRAGAAAAGGGGSSCGSPRTGRRCSGRTGSVWTAARSGSSSSARWSWTPSSAARRARRPERGRRPAVQDRRRPARHPDRPRSCAGRRSTSCRSC